MSSSSPPSLTLKFRSSAVTDIGRKRTINQDSLYADDELGLWIVADGMGGHAAGEVASRETVMNIAGSVRRVSSVEGGAPWEQNADSNEALQIAMRTLEAAVQSATYLLFSMSEFDLDMQGMGTTVSAMLHCKGRAAIAQVGDSRVYRIRDGQAEQLTEDHTLVNWQLRQGLITAEQALLSKKKNVITRAVGNNDYVEVDLFTVGMKSGDYFLLCSDGLHGYFSDFEMGQIVERYGLDSTPKFIELANERGGKDNITAMVLVVG